MSMLKFGSYNYFMNSSIFDFVVFILYSNDSNDCLPILCNSGPSLIWKSLEEVFSNTGFSFNNNSLNFLTLVNFDSSVNFNISSHYSIEKSGT